MIKKRPLYQIRKARKDDWYQISAIGRDSPELSPNSDQPFMTKAEYLRAIKKPLFLVIIDHEGDLAGFIYVRIDDVDVPPDENRACLVYIAVYKFYRRCGYGRTLWEHAQKSLRDMKVKSIYAWCASRPILSLLSESDFKPGGSYTWMDKKL